MRTSPKGILLIKKHEGFRPTAYKPTKADVWTIGYGHTHGVKEGDTCTVSQADAWLYDDVREAELSITNIGRPLTQNQFDALVSFAYNLGPGPLTHSGLHDALMQNDNQKAADELLKWIYQGKSVLHGLTVRRADERALFLA